MDAAAVFTTLDLELKPDPARTVIRPFSFDYPEAFAAGKPSRASAVASRLMALDEPMRQRITDVTVKTYEGMPHNIFDIAPDRCVGDLLAFLEARFGRAAGGATAA